MQPPVAPKKVIVGLVEVIVEIWKVGNKTNVSEVCDKNFCKDSEYCLIDLADLVEFEVIAVLWFF